MKIVQICPYAMARPGGVQRHVRDLTAWLESAGHQTCIIAPPAPGKVPKRSGALIELGHSKSIGAHGTAFEISAAAPWAVASVARELRQWGADLVHLHTPWTPMMAGQIWRKLRLPTVTTIHATLPDEFGAGLVDRYIRRSARYYLTRSQAVVTPSTTPIPQLQAFVPGLDPHILPPAVDLSAWFNTRSDRQHDGVHLVFLGRLEARKGISVLLEAWPRIAEVLPKARLTIAGDGGLKDQVLAATSARLNYIGAPGDAAAQALLGSADLFIAPATHGESYGLVLAEAMATGAIPIAAGNAGYQEVLGPEGSDLIVPPKDAQALAQKVITLAQNRADRDQWQAWAQSRAQHTDICVAGPKYISVYESVLKR